MLRNLIAFVRTRKTAKQRNEEKRQEFHAMLEKAFGCGDKPKRVVLKSITVPEELVVELLTKNADRTPAGQRAFWKFIYSNFSIQETDDLRISCKRITAPVVEVLAPEADDDEDEEDEIVSKVLIKEEDEDEMFRLFTLAQADGAGGIEKYNFWKAIEAKYPETIGFKNRAITLPNAVHIAIVDKKVEGEEDEE